MRTYILLATAVAIAGAVVPASSAYATPDGATIAARPLFEVALTMYDGDRLIAAPRMHVVAGEQGRVVIEPGDGSHYRLAFAVTETAPDVLNFASTLDVRSATATHGANLRVSPRLRLSVGETGQIVVGDEGEGMAPFRADITIRPVVG